jgi:SAM-dependent methyltransferase
LIEAMSSMASDVEAWEAAYARFETPAAEVRKFRRRFQWLGADRWPKDAEILELFCGRGGAVIALEQLGFKRLRGVDRSPRLVGQYRGRGRLVVADCRTLPIRACSHDIAIVQGGLHHLEALPVDLEHVLQEVQRVLRPGGLFVVVEPWPTRFLHLVHQIGCSRVGRRIWAKLDALAAMIEHEGETYQRWLGASVSISRILQTYFEPLSEEHRWGKLFFVGRNRAVVPGHPAASALPEAGES